MLRRVLFRRVASRGALPRERFSPLALSGQSRHSAPRQLLDPKETSDPAIVAKRAPNSHRGRGVSF